MRSRLLAPLRSLARRFEDRVFRAIGQLTRVTNDAYPQPPGAVPPPGGVPPETPAVGGGTPTGERSGR